MRVLREATSVVESENLVVCSIVKHKGHFKIITKLGVFIVGSSPSDRNWLKALRADIRHRRRVESANAPKKGIGDGLQEG